jgi:rhodanese-related sulfurtransferase
MLRKRAAFFLACFLLLLSSTAMAQFPLIDVEQVKSMMGGKQKIVIVDTRTFEEYQQAHIPGAINIMPEQIKSSSAILPKNKKTALIFYCRGMD